MDPSFLDLPWTRDRIPQALDVGDDSYAAQLFARKSPPTQSALQTALPTTAELRQLVTFRQGTLHTRDLVYLKQCSLEQVKEWCTRVLPTIRHWVRQVILEWNGHGNGHFVAESAVVLKIFAQFLHSCPQLYEIQINFKYSRCNVKDVAC